MVIDRFGEVFDQIKIDSCQRAITREQLTDALTRQGFKPVVVDPSSDGTFDAVVCADDQRITAKFSKYGDLVNQKQTTGCRLPTLNNIAESMRDNGLTDTVFFAVACRDGEKVRFRLNEFGDRLDRQKVGDC